jgi:integrase/recombinase XerD
MLIVNVILYYSFLKDKKDLAFDLPSANGANKSLAAIVTLAEINKHVTWHSSRHGFGISLIYIGTDIYTASQLLGHASLTYTKRYVRESSEMN